MQAISYTSQNMSETNTRRKIYMALSIFLCVVIFAPLIYWHTKTCIIPSPKIQFINMDVDIIYEEKYPLTDPVVLPNVKKYKIAIIADLDRERSRARNDLYKRKSYLKTGHLIVFKRGSYKVEFTETHELSTYLTEKGRGLELSELCVYNRGLYTVDDRTGVVFELRNNEPIPWVILQDGDGRNKKGFKSEWMTVRDGFLYIGSTGKEFTTPRGEFLNNNPLFVKRVSPNGYVKHLNWTHNYRRLRNKLEISDPGYIIHEAVVWSPIKQKWFILPRRLSTLKYDDELDENRATNVLITASFDFEHIDFIYVGDLDVTHGFASFKFIPGTNDDVAIALKTKEVGDDISSYVTIFNVNTGKTLMIEQVIANDKYEGIEFI